MKKQYLAFALVTLMLLSSLVGCAAKAPAPEATPAPAAEPAATEAPAAPEATEAPAEKAWKLGMLIPGSATDGGFCQLGAEAARAIQDKLGIEATIVEASTADKMVSEAEALIEDGYNIIFGHGAQYATPFSEISPDYPEVLFITAGGDVMTANQIPTFMAFEETCYLMGIVSANMSKTGNLGFVLGGSYPSYVKSANAILVGAQTVKSDIKYQYAILSNIDMNEAYETTMNQIKNGADIVFGNANAGTLGVLKAAIDTPGVYALGAMANYNADGPDTVLVSGVFDYNAGYIATVQKAIKGFNAGDYIKAGLSDGCTGLVWNDNLKAQVPAEVIAQVEEAQAKIISGEIKVPGDLDELIIAK